MMNLRWRLVAMVVWLGGALASPLAVAAPPVAEPEAASPTAAQGPPAERLLADRFVAARQRMVRDDIAGGGVSDPRVLASMRTTLRHEFVPVPQRSLAYFDMALAIGEKQTISGPFVVAYMTEQLALEPTDRVLEIGTGSGYQAAVLAPLVQTVYSIEISRVLGERAARTLGRLGYDNVVTQIGDGFQGWPEHAPFDKIIVTCSPEEIPAPLVEQLAEGGKMIIPVGERYDQTLVRLTKREGQMVREALVPSFFVPMTGAAEEARRVQPDGSRPALENGSFEEFLPASTVPRAWYYGRQMRVEQGADAPQGKGYLRLENAQAGRPAQLWQGFPVDGRVVGRLLVTLEVRASGIQEGLSPEEAPGLAIQFFDERRSRSVRTFLGPWLGTSPWKTIEGTLQVPAWAREAIVHIGMLGATGTLDVDAVQLAPLPRP